MFLTALFLWTWEVWTGTAPIEFEHNRNRLRADKSLTWKHFVAISYNMESMRRLQWMKKVAVQFATRRCLAICDGSVGEPKSKKQKKNKSILGLVKRDIIDSNRFLGQLTKVTSTQFREQLRLKYDEVQRSPDQLALYTSRQELALPDPALEPHAIGPSPSTSIVAVRAPAPIASTTPHGIVCGITDIKPSGELVKRRPTGADNEFPITSAVLLHKIGKQVEDGVKTGLSHDALEKHFMDHTSDYAHGSKEATKHLKLPTVPRWRATPPGGAAYRAGLEQRIAKFVCRVAAPEKLSAIHETHLLVRFTAKSLTAESVCYFTCVGGNLNAGQVVEKIPRQTAVTDLFLFFGFCFFIFLFFDLDG